MVGIGGIGMSSIAQVLLARGFRVTGSDAKKSEVTDGLEALGATVFEGHHADHMGGADVVVYSSAVKRDENPETLEALRRRLPLIERSIMLAELMRMKYGVGIAGTHGKTTTTSMTGLVCAEAGFDPTVIVGGKVAAFGSSNAVAGEGDVIVIEADEYDRTFLRLTPVFAVVTNIEADHLDIYEDLDDIRDAFTQYVRSVPFFGAAIVCLDDPGVQSILADIDRRLVTYGTTRQADVRADNIRREDAHTVFDVLLRGEKVGTVRLAVPGLHNVRNALAAVDGGPGDGRALRDDCRRDRQVHGRRAALRDHRRGAAACSSWTTTRTTRPRWPPRSKPLRAPIRSAASCSSSSRTSTPARATSWRSSPTRSSAPTCSCSPTSTPPASSPCPA